MHPAIQKLVDMDHLPATASAQAQALRAEIPAELLAHYDRLKARRKKGIAPVIDGTCQSCYLHLSTSAAARLRDKDDVDLCENCGCYIYPLRAAEPSAVAPRNGQSPSAHQRKPTIPVANQQQVV
jgi:hypothetical protein